jgi:hypothetical protein
MADRTFLQNSRIGRCSYQLQNDQIEVSWLSGARIDKSFALRTLSPDYTRGTKRFPQLFFIPGLVLIVGLALVIFILGQDTVPHNFVIYPAMYVAAGAFGLVRAIPRTEYFQFYDHWKKPTFFMVREKAQARECDDYVRLLLEEIDRANRGEKVVRTKAAPISTVFLPNPGDSYFAGEIRWQISLVFGSLSVGVPLIPKLSEYLEDLLFFQVFGCSFAGLVCAVLSYQSKERFRHIALVGAVLSLLAIYTYDGPLR